MKTNAFIEHARANGHRALEVEKTYDPFMGNGWGGVTFTLRHLATMTFIKVSGPHEANLFIYLIRNPMVPYEADDNGHLSIPDDEWKAHYILSTPGARL